MIPFDFFCEKVSYEVARGAGEHTESTSHIRIVVSSDADARWTLSDDHAMSEMPSVWPVRLRINCPV
jgi:hypothetical protein